MKQFALSLTALAMLTACNSPKDSYIGASEITVTDGKMTPEVLLSLGRISDPQLSPDGSEVLYGVSYTDIGENRSCRNLFIASTDGSSRRQLTKSPSSISNARWNADGTAVYYVRDGQIRLVSVKNPEKEKTLSNIPDGISEFAISPDFSKLIYISTIPNDKVKTPASQGLDKAKAYSTENLMYRHWNHWVTETPRTYIASLDDGIITKESSTDILGDEPYELPTEPFGGIEQLSWSPDGKLIAYSCRKKTGKEYAFSTNCGIYVYDVESGETTPVRTVGGYDTDPLWSEDGSKLIWISMARDGYEADRQRLFGATFIDGKAVAQEELLPEFDHDVQNLKWIDGKIYFCALVEQGVQAIFRCCSDGSGLERLTASDWPCDFFTPFGAKTDTDGSQTLFSTYYSINFPLEFVNVRIENGSLSYSRAGSENERILSMLDEPTTESICLKTVDGKDMQCWMVFPPKFDASKKYPAIEITLGGPQSANSQDWNYRWCYRLMAQQGYIVMLPNRRGTTAFGQEWKEQISGDYPGLNMQDYLTAGRYLRNLPYVGKIACVGASYGGYSVYMLEGIHDGLFDCFISHAGIFNEQQLWFTTEEMWFANWDNGGLSEYAYDAQAGIGPKGDGITFGGMQQAGAPYATTPKAKRHYDYSPASKVTKWNTPILCIHGEKDFRIPYEQGMAAFNAAQMMGIPSKLVIFPEECHWVLNPQNALYWHREVFEWLERWTGDSH